MASSKFQLVGFGEAMIRYAPIEDKDVVNRVPLPDPTAGVFLRSVGGDELNVCVDFGRLDGQARPIPQWISVLPTGPLGDLVMHSGELAGIDASKVARVENATIGTFTVLPELKMVHYQRHNAAFAEQDPSLFDWNELLSEKNGVRKWLHMTGITPMVGPKPAESWKNALDTARKLGVPVSMDFNHRKQLGTLEQLWTMMEPQLESLQLLILSLASMVELANMLKIEAPEGAHHEDPAWTELMTVLRQRWKVARLVVCFKTRDETGLQKRWSVLVDESSAYSTLQTPIYHKPKDECGGGSAWAAGFLDWLYEFGTKSTPSNSMTGALRRADLLAAMCQETIGDHSQVTRRDLSQVEKTHQGKAVYLDNSKSSGTKDKEQIDVAGLQETMAKLSKAGVLGILRAKNADAAIERGIELVSLGLRAIEVTLDTTDWRRVLKTLTEKLPADVCIGVGTVMDDTVCCLEEIRQLGGKFALSPINPTGFINECHRVGLVAVPAGLTSNELWDMKRQGAVLLKMFHAGQVTAKILKSMLGVSPLRAMNIMPSGGVSPDNVEEWLDAGAFIVGMGSNLAGKDINYAYGTEEYTNANESWKNEGRAAATTLIEKIQKRYA
eukprot:m.34176 g.34176  ORF g.34176 m.34176 type:complete len:611 (+) comp8684_c0_seq1:108-1940(+)